jgi:hypothetical protein
MAYKDPQTIISTIGDTVRIENRFARSTTLNPATGLRAKRKNNVRRFQNEENHSFGFGGTAA